MLVYILSFGLWGFLLKICTTKLDWKTTLTYVWMTVFAILFFTYFIKVKIAFGPYHGLAVAAGVLAAIGTVAFYKALSLAPASIIIPLSGQYILVTVLLAMVFLNEPVTLRSVAGIVFGITAMILLSK